MSFSPVEMEEQVFAVMEIILSDPTTRWPIIADKVGLDKEALFEVFDYLDRESYLENMRFARGKGNRIAVPFLENAVITEKGLDFMKRMKVAAPVTTPVSEEATSMPTVFISYNWDNESVAVSIEEALQGKAIVLRDKKSIPAWGSLTEFMKSIRKQDFAVLIISEVYLKSSACMFEAMQLMKDEIWREKAMFVVLKDTHIYNPLGRADYINFWTNQCIELEAAIAPLPASSTSELNTDLKKVVTVRDNIGEFLSTVADTSNPDPEKVVQAIVDRVESGNGNEYPYSSAGDVQKCSLSTEAAAMLITAASGGMGTIVCSPTLSSFGISINDKAFVNLATPVGREVALWKAGLESLISLGLIEGTDYKGEVFNVTATGYNVADQYSAQMRGDRIVCPQCHYCGPTFETGVCPICKSKM